MPGTEPTSLTEVQAFAWGANARQAAALSRAQTRESSPDFQERGRISTPVCAIAHLNGCARLDPSPICIEEIRDDVLLSVIQRDRPGCAVETADLAFGLLTFDGRPRGGDRGLRARGDGLLSNGNPERHAGNRGYQNSRNRRNISHLLALGCSRRPHLPVLAAATDTMESVPGSLSWPARGREAKDDPRRRARSASTPP